MPRYLFAASYSPDGVKGVLAKGGTARRTAIEKAAADLGGRVETFDFAFGENDVYTIMDLPGPGAAAALALTVSASGGASVKTIVLLTAEEIDEATHLTLGYVPPGG